MLALAFVVFSSIPPEVPVDPPPSDSFGALCVGPWMHADAVAPYRGVVVEDNGSGRCCPLAHGTFACVMSPGHQHGPVVRDHLRFYDGTSKTARVDLVVAATPNPGMAPNPNPPPPFAELALSTTSDGFVLRPIVQSACAKPAAEAREVCRNVGRWILRAGLPAR